MERKGLDKMKEYTDAEVMGPQSSKKEYTDAEVEKAVEYSDAEVMRLPKKQPQSASKFGLNALKAVIPGAALVGDTVEAFGQDVTNDGTRLTSAEGLATIPKVASITLGSAVNSLQNMAGRPEESDIILDPKRLLRRRQLEESGVSRADAEAQSMQEAQATFKANLNQFEAKAAGDRASATTARQEAQGVNPSEALQHAQNIASSAAVTALSLAVGARTKNLPLALSLGAAPQYPSAYDQSREAGSSHERAQVSAGLSTAVEAGFEVMPVSKLLKDLGTDEFLKLAGKYILREEQTEIPTTLVQSIISQTIDTPDKPFGQFMNELGTQLYNTAVETPFSAGIGAGVAHALGGKTSQPIPIMPPHIQEKVEELKKAAEAGDDVAAEVAHNEIMDLIAEEKGQLNGQTLNQSPPNSFVEPAQIAPEREAGIQILEPLDDAKVAELVSSFPEPAVPDGLQNDGTKALGIDEAFGGDSQIGQTRKAMANAENYEPDVNDATPRSLRPILFGPPEVVGHPIGAVQTQAGVYTIGEASDSRSNELLSATHDLYSQLQKAFAPNATIILSGETMGTRQAVGMMQRLGSGEYVVVPAQARSVDSTDAGKLNPQEFNASTRAKILYNAYHEFGHVLTMERFYENVSPELQLTALGEQRNGLFTEETLAQMPAENAAVMREYNAMRQAMKTKNAAWFQSEWMGPALAVQRQLITDKGAQPDTNAESFVRRLVSHGDHKLDYWAHKLRLSTDLAERQDLQRKRDERIQQLVNEYLSFDEYMAEQFSRYSHQKDLTKGTGLGSQQMFKGGADHVRNEEQIRHEGLTGKWAEIRKSLQKLFVALKRGIKLDNGQTYKIKAGVSFNEWVASLSRLSQLMAPQKNLVEVTGKAKEKVVEDKVKLPTYAETPTAQKLRRDVTYGHFSPSQKQVLYKLIRENALVTAEEQMVKYLEGKIKLQLDTDKEAGVAFAGLTEEQAKNPKIAEMARNAWVRHGAKSPYFRAWFGDQSLGHGQGSYVTDGRGGPLGMFHATQGDFSKFTQGDIGFHFGDLKAAHARMYKISPINARDDTAMQGEIDNKISQLEKKGQKEAQLPKDSPSVFSEKVLDWSIIPAFLNIRNPIVLSEDGQTDMWNTPTDLGNVLRDRGIITQKQLQKVWELEQQFMLRYGLDRRTIKSVGATKLRYHMFEPLRSLLIKKGYDGIMYENYVEGGRSWVPFTSGQIKTANGTFSASQDIHYQRDVDLSTPVGLEIDTLSRTLDAYENMSVTQVALRQLAKSQWYVLQLQQLAWVHPEFHFLDMANDAAMQYTAAKSRLQALGEQTAQAWMKLGKETDAKLSKALEAEVAEGKHWVKLENTEGQFSFVPTQETFDKFAEFGLVKDTTTGDAAIKVYLQSKNVILQQLNAAQVSLLRRIAQTLNEDQKKEWEIRANEVRKTFKEIRETPFLPRGDYGKWGLVVYEQQGTERKVVFRQMFESETELAKARVIVQRGLQQGQTVKTITDLADEHRAMLAIPLEYVDMAADVLDLTDEQKDVLTELLHPVKTDKLVQPYAKALEKLGGGSKDRMRNFADFVWHNSTLIARTEAIPALNKAKAAARHMFAEVNAATMDETARQRLLSDIKRGAVFLDKTTGYMLTPPNEWYSARSVVALVYLWGSIKTAALNLVGIITTMSALTSQYGDLDGGSALAKAHKQLAQLLATGKSDEFATELYDRALDEGFLVQSYAAHLAGAATAGVTKRIVNRSRWSAEVGQRVGQVADGGMLPFTLAEQYTRRITFLAQVNALREDAIKEGRTIHPSVIYAEAVKQTDLLQNSYSLANRPMIMRGGAGITSGLIPMMTIFLSFMGHFTFNAAGGYTLGAERRGSMTGKSMPKSVLSNTKRMLVALLLLGGYEALPGVENILDVLDVLCLKLWGKTARQLVREEIKQIPEVPGASWVNDPRWWGKGLGGDVWGFDVSGSLGIGRLIPGTDTLAGSPETAGEVLGRAIPAMAGVAGSLGVWATQTALDAWNGKDLTQNLTKFPGVVGAVSSAVQWGKDGVRGRSGDLVYEPSQKEVIGKALNFTPSGLSEKRETDWAKRQAFDFWTTKRGNLQEAYNRAKDARDREAIADALAAVKEFNDEVYDSRMRLKTWQLNSSYREHHRSNRDKERGVVGRNVKNLARDVESSFADGGDE